MNCILLILTASLTIVTANERDRRQIFSTVINYGQCPDGSVAVDVCSNTRCLRGYFCTSQKLCCADYQPGNHFYSNYVYTVISYPNRQSWYSCPDGGDARDICNNTPCIRDEICINKVCCSNTAANRAGGIPDGVLSRYQAQPPLRMCLNGGPFRQLNGLTQGCQLSTASSDCPPGYQCSNAICCPMQTTVPVKSTMPPLARTNVFRLTNSTIKSVQAKTVQLKLKVVDSKNISNVTEISQKESEINKCHDGSLPFPALQCPCILGFSCEAPAMICCRTNYARG